MSTLSKHPIRNAGYGLAVSLLAVSSLAFAQDQQQDQAPPPDAPQQQSPNGGWRRASDPPPADANQAPPQANQGNQPTFSTRPNYSAYPNYSQGQYSGPNQPADQPPQPVPPQLTLKPGTFVTVRINQVLSSDRNQPGDAFTATLVRPVVVNGVVVAQRGQTIGGRVAEAKKAGRVEGVSRLGVQLTDLTLVDGQQMPIQSQLISRNGPTSVGRDAGAIAGTTALGAAAGAIGAGGVGAGIGAGAGAVVGIVGVMLTRGRPTVLYPESVLTFRIEAPVTISTERAPQAFRYVDPNEYDRPYDAQGPPRQAPGPYAGYGYGGGYGYGSGYGYGYAPGYYPYPYYAGYYPYYWGGPGLGLYWGSGFGFGYGRGFYGGGYGRGFGRGFAGGRR